MVKKLLVIGSLCVLGLKMAYAGAIFTIAATTNFPTSNVSVNSTTNATFTVTNSAGGTLSGISVQALPDYVTQITSGDNACGSTFTLAANASCNLYLRYIPTAANRFDAPLRVCSTTPKFCSKMSTNISAGTYARDTSNDRKPIFSIAKVTDFASSFVVGSGTTADYLITNNLSSTLSNIEVSGLPTGVTQKTTGVSPCAKTFSLAGGASCHLYMLYSPSSASTLNIPSQRVKVCSAVPKFCSHKNIKILTTGTDLPADVLNINGGTISIPNQSAVNVTVQNVTAHTATINSVQLANTVMNVTVDASNCTSIAGNGACSITLTPTANSYGSGLLTITYTVSNEQRTYTKTVSVAEPTLTMAVLDDSDTPIAPNIYPNGSNAVTIDAHANGVPTVNDGNTKIRITNTGTFNLQPQPAVTTSASWGSGYLSEKVSLSGCGSVLAPNASCDLTLTNTEALTEGNSTVLTTSFINRSSDISTTVSVDGGLVLTVDTANANKHMAYKAIKVHTQGHVGTGQNIPISVNNAPVISGGLSGKMKFCASNDANAVGTAGYCAFKSTCALNTNLGDGNCLLWFKSLKAAAPESATGTITVNMSDDSVAKSFVFNTKPETVMVVGGDFTAAGGTAVNDLAMYNGSAWQTFGSTSGSLYTALGGNGEYINKVIADQREDLFMLGKFSDDSSYYSIAKWNGSSFVPITGLSGVPNVKDSAMDSTGTLYFVGDSDKALKSLSGGATALASELPSIEPEGNDISNIAIDSTNKIYLAASTPFTSGTSSPVIQKPSGGSWSLVGTLSISTGGSGGTPYSLAVLSTGQVIMGGAFENMCVMGNGNTAGGCSGAWNASADNLIYFNGSLWAPFISGRNGAIHSIFVEGSNVYVAGDAYVGISGQRMLSRGTGSSWYVSTVNDVENYADDTIRTITGNSSNIYFGGDFTGNIKHEATDYPQYPASNGGVSNAGDTVNTLLLAANIACFKTSGEGSC